MVAARAAVAVDVVAVVGVVVAVFAAVVVVVLVGIVGRVCTSTGHLCCIYLCGNFDRLRQSSLENLGFAAAVLAFVVYGALCLRAVLFSLVLP